MGADRGSHPHGLRHDPAGRAPLRETEHAVTSNYNGAEMKVAIKHVYDEPQKSDGKRILVDRLWPRALTKEKAKVDLWLKEIAPSNELRKWFGHDPEKWAEFQKRYAEELKSQ